LITFLEGDIRKDNAQFACLKTTLIYVYSYSCSEFDDTCLLFIVICSEISCRCCYRVRNLINDCSYFLYVRGW